MQLHSVSDSGLPQVQERFDSLVGNTFHPVPPFEPEADPALDELLKSPTASSECANNPCKCAVTRTAQHSAHTQQHFSLCLQLLSETLS